MNIVGFLADQHHPKAEFMKGMWLEFGKFGMRVDKKDAFRCYTRAAEKGYARAEYRMGMQFEQSNDPIKALMHYKRGSEAGDSASNYRLGMMTLLGQHGQPQDYAKGIQLIRQAAATADENAPQGAYVLGMLQARELPQINVPEIFLPYDEKSARQSIEKAAYLGFAKAQLKMGSAYELCTLGCEFNPTLSMHYNALASRQGESDADMAISKWFLCGYENEFKKNEELAYAYAERAAASNLATAQFAMGYFNEIGMATEKNLEKASDWYEKAARAGNKDAASRLEGLAKSQTLNKKDHENIAIQKIKSQYGSMRGARPARLQKHTVPALPSIVDDSPSAASDASPMANRLPDRNASTTPYPISDKPPVVANVPALGAPSPYDRGSTTTPYPMGDGPPMGPPRTGSFAGGFAPEVRSASTVPPNSRPLSAFNINPNIYPQDRPGTVVPPRLAPYQQGNMGQMPMRPYTSMDNMGQGGGRDPRDVRMNGFPPDPNPYRGPGTPSVERPEPYGTPRPGDYGGQPGHRPGDYAGRPGPRPGDYGGQPGRPDMGYQAPSPQVPPPDGRNKLQKVGGNPNKLKAQPTLPDIGFEAPLAPAPLAPKHGPKPPQHSQSFSNGRPATVQPGQDRSSAARPQERPGTAAPGGYPAPRPGSSGKPGRGDSPQPPLKNDKSDLPSQRKPGEQKKPIEQKKPGDTSRPADKPAAAPAAPKPAAAHQPGKGPKTFDEMGVPAQAGKENECVSDYFFKQCYVRVLTSLRLSCRTKGCILRVWELLIKHGAWRLHIGASGFLAFL
jgi:TPR repeat protein